MREMWGLRKIAVWANLKTSSICENPLGSKDFRWNFAEKRKQKTFVIGIVHVQTCCCWLRLLKQQNVGRISLCECVTLCTAKCQVMNKTNRAHNLLNAYCYWIYSRHEPHSVQHAIYNKPRTKINMAIIFRFIVFPLFCCCLWICPFLQS